MRYFGRVFSMYPSEYFTLSFNDIRQYSHILLIRATSHGYISIATHPDGHDTLVLTTSFRPFDEERIYTLLIRSIIPRTDLLPAFGIIFMRTHHRFMMRSTHHDTHIVCQLSVRQVILIKRTGPHGRPHIVGFQPEQQFEHVRIKTAVEPTELFGSPSPKARPFIVQENTTIFHFGRILHITSRFHIQFCMPLRRYVGKIMPRRHTDFFRQVVYAENSTTLVAPCYHEISVYRLYQITFPFSFNGRHVKLPLLHPFIDLPIPADRSGYHHSPF